MFCSLRSRAEYELAPARQCSAHDRVHNKRYKNTYTFDHKGIELTYMSTESTNAVKFNKISLLLQHTIFSTDDGILGPYPNYYQA